MAGQITPRTLKGFRDLLPALAIPRERMVDSARGVFRSYGFAPIETPALELSEVLLGKLDAEAEIQRQLYRFTDNGGRDVALRFDLTVPFARFAAQHIGQLGTPFKRYAVGQVWRGENTQAGRYREFTQCDFDTIGTTSVAADVEIALVINDLLVALGFDGITIRVSDRRVLTGLLGVLGVVDKAPAVLRSVDKLAKQGREAVTKELVVDVGLTDEQAVAVLDATDVTDLDRLAARLAGDERGSAGIAALRTLLEVAAGAGAGGRLRLDLSISRGLDYYTGMVFETFLDDLPSIGSVCSGGRYDDLAGLYTKQALPGVGASLGLDRLLAAMEELGLVGASAAAAPVLLVQFPGGLGDVVRLAGRLRAAGIGAEVYPDERKIGVQLQYAERRGLQVAVLVGPEERAAGVVKVKDLAARTERTVAEEDLVDEVRSVLA